MKAKSFLEADVNSSLSKINWRKIDKVTASIETVFLYSNKLLIFKYSVSRKITTSTSSNFLATNFVETNTLAEDELF